ncbi:MAG: spoIIIJ-associated protein [Acidobacteriota bacterium]|jgi:spoIIIJ-associated protein|nr:spoIIIJ-associated protein [Acidobacteriota bacterium]MDT7807039.1 spoIIIJ-associated protein [Acidobacteriota bacterium]
MKEAYGQAEQFLNDIFRLAGFSLHAEASESADGCILNIDGTDSALVRSEGGEFLDALEHFVNQSFARGLSEGERFVCDVDNFRAIREMELRAMARHAAERVRSTGLPFFFGPMSAGERRIIHMTLAEENTLFTESVGEGNARRLKVSLKTPSKI